jgi:exodeoxyribonuclease VII large subunit
VGVVTSGTGAAIRDILNVISRRFPNLHLRLYPVKVQGREAATEIAEAISYFDSEAEMDVLIVGRGGGSLEDLWCFNEEIVARAIAGCQIPVISAVGHEIDFTISDFTADLRAPTPSAAAELVVGQKTEYENRITELGGRLLRALREEIINARNRLKTAEGSYVFREPGHMVDRYRQALEGSQLQMKHQLVEAARQAQQRMDDISIRMTHETKLWSQRCRQNLTRIQSQLNAYNPRGVLKRGYSLTKDSNGRIVRSPHDVGADDIIWTELSAGMIESRVLGGKGAGRNGPDSERQESRT